MEKVSISRGVLVGLVAVAAVSLLAVAFLVGRASAPASAPAPPASPIGATGAADVPPPAAPQPATAPPAADPLARSDERPADVTLPTPPAPRAAYEPAPPVAAPSPAPSRSANDPDRAAVAAYFDVVDRIQPAEISGSAESAANELAVALAKGDTSGLDAMIRDSEAAKAKLAAVVPPPACAAHYRESAASLDDGLAMLRALKAAVESTDPVAALAAVGARATELRSRADALQREDAALRQRFGLAR